MFQKYYRGSTDSESPCPTYVARGFSFDDEEIFDVKKFCKPKSKRLSIETTNVADSPFSTFGKTPPKLLPITSLQKLNHVVEVLLFLIMIMDAFSQFQQYFSYIVTIRFNSSLSPDPNGHVRFYHRCGLSSVIYSHFNLLSQNYSTNWYRTW